MRLQVQEFLQNSGTPRACKGSRRVVVQGNAQQVAACLTWSFEQPSTYGPTGTSRHWQEGDTVGQSLKTGFPPPFSILQSPCQDPAVHVAFLCKRFQVAGKGRMDFFHDLPPSLPLSPSHPMGCEFVEDECNAERVVPYRQHRPDETHAWWADQTTEGSWEKRRPSSFIHGAYSPCAHGKSASVSSSLLPAGARRSS